MPYHANDLIDLINLGMPLTGKLIVRPNRKDDFGQSNSLPVT
jgi:hypothetical protein